ncbi:MAG: FtsX-like permease family protein, partial [Planctomycetales bacterium]
ARGKGIKTGDKYSIGPLSVNVAGIFQSNNLAEENYVYCHLDFLQRSKGMNLVGTVTQLEVLLNEGVDAAAKCREIDEKFSGGPVETDTRPKGVFQTKSLGDLIPLIGMAHYLGYACVGLVLALVATTTVMSVQDRITEHAVLRAIGFTALRVFQLVMAESLLLSLTGGLLGVAVAMLMLKLMPISIGAEAVAIPFTPSLHLALTGIVVALVAGLLAGLVPAWHAARTEIVPALRQV